MVRICLCIAVLFICVSAFAQSSSKPGSDSSEMIVKVYDLSDLMLSAIDHELPADGSGVTPDRNYSGGGGGGGGGALFGGGGGGTPAASSASDDAIRQISPDEIGRELRRLIAPQSWTDATHMVMLGRRLIVRQTPAVHGEIEKFLADLKDPSATRTFCFRAYWVVLPPDQITSLGVGKPLAGETPVISEETFEKLPVVSTGQVTAINNKVVYLVAGHEISAIADVNAVVGTGAAGFDPDVRLLRTGVSMQLKASMLRGAEEALVDVYSRAGDVQLSSQKRVPIITATTQPAAIAGDGEIDRQNRQVQELTSTLKMPLGKKVLVAGTTIDPNAEHSPVVSLVLELNLSK